MHSFIFFTFHRIVNEAEDEKTVHKKENIMRITLAEVEKDGKNCENETAYRAT